MKDLGLLVDSKDLMLTSLYQFNTGSSSVEGDDAVPLESMKLPWCIHYVT